MSDTMIIGIIGSGAMGSGIAQVAAQAGHPVMLYDNNLQATQKALGKLKESLEKLEAKGKITGAAAIIGRIHPATTLEGLRECGLVIEAIVENLDIKKKVLNELEQIVSHDCIIATNTSSLSVTSIAASCVKPQRVIGLHFFNPPPLMALVEVIPAIQTDAEVTASCTTLMRSWKKVPVLAKDTPGFIVNRVARPFYGEALRIYEEGLASKETIDRAMVVHGGFKMGPFALMDYIGHDVNYVVTETVFQSFFYDPRYKPSFTQKRLLEAGWLGRKSGKGFYDYTADAVATSAIEDEHLEKTISDRIIAMLMNEAIEALYLQIATEEDLDLAMTKGVNYPKGLLAWAKEWGNAKLLNLLDTLYNEYHEDRYRSSVLLRKGWPDLP